MSAKVKWYNVPIDQFFDTARTITLDGNQVLDRISEMNPKFDCVLDLTTEGGESFTVPYTVKELFKPIGSLGRQLVKDANVARAISLMREYWEMSKVKPEFMFDVVQVESEDKKPFDVLIRTKSGSEDVGFTKLLEGIDHSIFTRNYSRVYMGGRDDHMELQFLSTSNRKQNIKGELFDPGMFVKVNGRVDAAPGVHWLVCTNGLTRQMRFVGREGLQVLNDETMLRDSINLLDWLIEKQGVAVGSIRELSVAFSSKYGKSFLSKFWKSWAEKIELKTLTWFDVFDDMTREVRDTLSGHRYDVMSVADRMQSTAFCPTCSASCVVQHDNIGV